MNSILNEDIYKVIISISSISMMKSLSLVSKLFYNICSDNSIWLKIFKTKKLWIWNNNINNVNNYIDEYNKVSYIVHTCDSLFGRYEFLSTQKRIIIKNTDENIDINKDINDKKLNIFPQYIENDENVKILEFCFSRNHETNCVNIKFRLKYQNYIYNHMKHQNQITYAELYLILFRLYYNYQSIEILDVNNYPFVVHQKYYDSFMEYYRDYDGQDIVIDRKIYWDECYRLYAKKYY
jgi:hypothetical protein